MADTTAQLDTTIDVVTPENIAFRYRVAGPFRRLLAYLIDLMIRAAVLIGGYYVILMITTWLGVPMFGYATMILMTFVMSWFYGGILETYWNGQTVGKRALGIRVLSTDGRPIDALQAIMRNILRDVDALPVFLYVFPSYLFGLAAVTITARFQRLGDLACRTMVVADERSWLSNLARVDDPAAIELAARLPPTFELSRTLREALAGYVERRRLFPPGRRADIARHVGAPLCRRFGLPPETSHDLLLCALYYRTYMADEARTVENSKGGGHPPVGSGHGSGSRVAAARPLAGVS